MITDFQYFNLNYFIVMYLYYLLYTFFLFKFN